MIGPTILQYGHRGTEETLYSPNRQRRDPLVPGILGAGIAGSDLANIQTKAIPDGDDYIVKRSKDLDQLW